MESTKLIRFVQARKRPWNKGRLTGQEPPLQPKHVWAIRTRLQLANRIRDLALFNLAIDCKSRGRDVVSLRAEEIAPGLNTSVGQPTGSKKPADRSVPGSPSKTGNRHGPTCEH